MTIKIFFFLLTAVCLIFTIAGHSQAAISYISPITHIKVTGIYSISVSELLYMLNIHTGEMLNRSDLKNGLKRAFRKGIFDDIIVESESDNNSVIKITVREKKIIRSIRITGNERLQKKYIKKLIGIDEGERLNLLRIQKAGADLKRGLEEKGYIDSQVNYSIIPRDDRYIDIAFSIKEGRTEPITKIIITEPDDIVSTYLRLSEGSMFDRTEMEQLQKKVYQHYKKQGHIGTSLSYVYDRGVLDIKLDAGKRLSISFTGNQAIPSATLSSEIPFFEINEFSDELAEETTARLLSLYHKHGYAFAEIVPIVSSGTDAVSLNFFIYEGEKIVVSSIDFQDATIPSEKLLNMLVLGLENNYNPDNLEADTQTIKDFYLSLGYVYAEVQEPKVEITGNKAALLYKIKEGIQVKFDKINIKNNSHISEGDILKVITLKKGDLFNEVDISDAKRKILELYNRRGYLETKVVVEASISGTSAVVSFNIHEGDVTLLGKVIITGNKITRQAVIEREFLHKEGMPFDYSLILKERQKLYRLGLFSDIEVELMEKAGNKRDVLYKIKESNAGAVEFGIGYGEYEKQRGFVEVNYRNIGGMNRQGSFRTEVSTLEQRFILSYLEPRFMSRELPFKTMFLNEKRTEKSIDTGETSYRLKRSSVSTGIEKKLWGNLKGDLYYDFSFVETTDVKPDIILSKEDVGSLVISGVRTGLIFDSRDNPFDPKEGILAGLSFRYVSSLFFSETEFTKLMGYINKYYSLSKRVVLAASLKGGSSQGFGETRELPIVERFFLGGRTTVRGYNQDTVGPKGKDGTPTGGNAFVAGNIELRTAIKKGFGVVAFIDGGNVWKKSESVTMTDLKHTAGLGLRYNTPVGPFRLDYGRKFKRDTGESKGEIHFSLGHAF